MSVNEAAADKDPNSGIKVKHEASMFAKKTVYAHKTTHVYCIYGCVCVCVCLWLDVVDCCCCCCCCICFWGYQGNRKCWFRAAGVRSSRCRHCVRSFPVWQTHGATGWMDNRLPNLKCWITGNFSRHWETGGESSASDQCIFTITLSRSLVTWSWSHTNTDSEMCVDIRRLPNTSPRGWDLNLWSFRNKSSSPTTGPWATFRFIYKATHTDHRGRVSELDKMSESLRQGQDWADELSRWFGDVVKGYMDIAR